MSPETICVIGAGSSGLVALKALRDRGLPVVGFERGSNVGGNWRYENDSGASGAYASLRCNVSRRRMEYPSFPMPASYGDFPGHADMAAYFAAYTDAFGLRRHIRFSTTVERVEPRGDGSWSIGIAGEASLVARAVVVANGHHWDPRWPAFAGSTTARMLHSREYRTPESFAGKRVLIVGAGQSGSEIATEVSRVAARTLLSLRSGVHVVPRHLLGRPYDALSGALVNRLPWRLLNWLVARLVAAERPGDPSEHGLPRPPHRLLEQIPIVSSDLVPALQTRAVTVKPAVARLDGERVAFADGSVETVDAIVCATGYRLSFPFLPPGVLEQRGGTLPLYRRIVPLGVPGLFFIGLVDAPSGLLPIVELQSDWLADLLDGTRALPARMAMLAAARLGERRSRQRFPLDPPYGIRCDPFAYARLLEHDRRRRTAARIGATLRERLANLRNGNVDRNGRRACVPSSNPL
jgi:hypothetical protein